MAIVSDTTKEVNCTRGVAWHLADWSRQDKEIAATLGVTHEAVRLARLRFGAPVSPVKGRLSRTLDLIRSIEHSDAPLLRHLPNAAIHAAVGATTCLATTRAVVKDFGFCRTRRGRKRPLSAINFDLPNAELERIWRAPFNYFGSARCTLRKGPAAWCVAGGHWPEGDAAYDRAVAAEKAKAAEWFRLLRGGEGECGL